MSIYIGEPVEVSDYSAMQGPCPDGFHVPLDTEWRGIQSIMSGLSLSASTSWSEKLHLPHIYFRRYSSGSIANQSYTRYWCSNFYPNSSTSAYCLRIYWNSTSAYVENNMPSYGFGIRPFKDNYVEPDSTWTVIHGTLGSAGIFWNQTEGIISVTNGSDKNYTIADKNLGATTVYNSGDTKSQSNCGKLYQFGNNYGFPYEGDVSTAGLQVNASKYGPGNYYSSSTFIKTSNAGNYQWDSSGNRNLRGGETGVVQRTEHQVNNIYLGEGKEYSDMQGPCPDGFHVPLSLEISGLNTIMKGLGLTTGDSWRINLHMPFAGYRDYSASIIGQGSEVEYWSSKQYGPANLTKSDLLYLKSSFIGAPMGEQRSYCAPIRGFKNSFEVPTSSWTVINGTLGSAGIFWNQTDGLISITSNGTTGYTIADKNLGATAVYSDGDTLSQANMGNMYQWGNNYGFPSTGTISNTSSTKVNAQNYGPGNYYSSSTFITSSDNWDSSNNSNLRGGESKGSGIKPNIKAVYLGGPREVIVSDMQGPAPYGFHVPLYNEWEGLKTIMDGLGLTTGDNWRINLHMPFAGRRLGSDPSSQGSNGYYWSSSPRGSSYPDSAYYHYLNSSTVADYSEYRTRGFSVRCFKDSFELPTSSWTVVQGTLGSAGIFWNQSEGLISITSNGTTGYTIMDKNLGATIVYSDGDMLSENNCGYYYQRGNNYGFAFTGSVTTSSTRVNASTYGPGNYYTGSTFITASGSPYNRDSSNNANLRGGTTQGSSTKTVYNKIRPKE